MGIAPQENKQRNQNLKKDYETGTSMIDLVNKYQISSTRIYQILKLSKKRSN